MKSPDDRRATVTFGVILTLAVLVGGIFYVKWDPYFHKAFVAHASHSLGSPILSVGNPTGPSWQAAWSYAYAYGKDIWTALVVGILAGSAIQTLIPGRTIARWLGASRLGTVALSAAFAVPSMMCTCCSAPVVVGMRQRQASIEAALTYWLGNPLLNPATFVFTGFVLSWGWAVYRLGAGLVLVAVVAWLIRRFTGQSGAPVGAAPLPEPSATVGGMLSAWAKTAGRLALWVVPEWAVIALALGAVRTWILPVGSHPLAFGILLVIGLAVAGTLFVIPTAGEVPIAQAMLAAGAAPGLAGVLLITLPAISLPSMVMTRMAFPLRVLAYTAATVALFGVLAGLFTQAVF